MAGSYKHVVNDEGDLLEFHLKGRYVGPTFTSMIENLGDAYEAVEEMHWMIRYLANGDQAKIEEALAAFYKGRRLPPTVEASREGK